MFNPSVEEAISLLYIAKGFEVSHLVERCSKLLKTEINVENAPVFYMKANEYGEHQLEEHAKSFIIKLVADRGPHNGKKICDKIFD
jgi:hypothetical protein